NEPIVLARKPLEKGLTVAENVLKWGCGAINVDGSRIETSDKLQKLKGSFSFSGSGGANEIGKKIDFVDAGLGRWPANVILDEDAASVLDEQVKGILHGPGNKNPTKIGSGKNVKFNKSINGVSASRFQLGGDPSKASRFFYV